eukprot:scaffold201805_cov28-Tisochrysis_lutea.AAC.1
MSPSQHDKHRSTQQTTATTPYDDSWINWSLSIRGTGTRDRRKARTSEDRCTPLCSDPPHDLRPEPLRRGEGKGRGYGYWLQEHDPVPRVTCEVRILKGWWRLLDEPAGGGLQSGDAHGRAGGAEYA